MSFWNTNVVRMTMKEECEYVGTVEVTGNQKQFGLNIFMSPGAC